MNLEKLKHELKNLKVTEAKIKSMELKIRELGSDYITVASPKFNDGIRSTSISSPTETQAIKILEKKKLYEKALERERNKVLLINYGITALDPTEKQIVISFFIENKSWCRVGAELNYSERQCRRISERALEKMLEVINY